MEELELSEKRELIENIKKLSLERKADIVINPYKYKGFGRNFYSECKVQVWLERYSAIVLFTDNGVGTSVTNASEQLVTEVFNKYLLPYEKEACLFMETYDKKEAVDIIIPKWNGNKAESVTWVHLGKVV